MRQKKYQQKSNKENEEVCDSQKFCVSRIPENHFSFNLQELLSSEVCFEFLVQTDTKFKAKLRAAKFLFKPCHRLLI